MAKTVFDEWAVVSLAENKARVLAYIGSAARRFPEKFCQRPRTLRAELHNASYGVGDFAFARPRDFWNQFLEAFPFWFGGGDLFDLQQHAGNHGYELPKTPRWLSAQVSFWPN